MNPKLMSLHSLSFGGVGTFFWFLYGGRKEIFFFINVFFRVK